MADVQSKSCWQSCGLRTDSSLASVADTMARSARQANLLVGGAKAQHRDRLLDREARMAVAAVSTTEAALENQRLGGLQLDRAAPFSGTRERVATVQSRPGAKSPRPRLVRIRSNDRAQSEQAEPVALPEKYGWR